MHKDLNEDGRKAVALSVEYLASYLHIMGQSLGIGREAMIAEFDRLAEELDGNQP